MPRYYFHHRTENRMFWDKVGLDLPDLWQSSDPEMVVALWHEALAKGTEAGQVLIITDEERNTLFVAAL
jgi:hypothetical protein